MHPPALSHLYHLEPLTGPLHLYVCPLFDSVPLHQYTHHLIPVYNDNLDQCLFLPVFSHNGWGISVEDLNVNFICFASLPACSNARFPLFLSLFSTSFFVYVVPCLKNNIQCIIFQTWYIIYLYD